MKLPVDTSAIAFLCAVEAEPVVDFETKRPRADENGEPLYVIQLLAMGDGSADLLAVKVPGVPSQAIRQGHPVKVHGLVAQPWTMNDRSGVAFRAALDGEPGPVGVVADRPVGLAVAGHPAVHLVAGVGVGQQSHAEGRSPRRIVGHHGLLFLMQGPGVDAPGLVGGGDRAATTDSGPLPHGRSGIASSR